MYFIYILRSSFKGRYYIGHTVNVLDRLREHNRGWVRSTKSGIPWVIVYSEKFRTKQNAVRRELQIKSYKGGEVFKRLVSKELVPAVGV